jgi:phosphoglycolate phosphatase-like HAD superfamily hydrolase
MLPDSMAQYRSWVFDCDGVLLDSNRIKTEAFHTVALRFGVDAADALTDFHIRNGGISRYAKFAYLLEVILGRQPATAELDTLCHDYAEHVFTQLLDCPVAEGLPALREATANARWMVVSGGAEHELREVFVRRGLDSLFDAGIHGSPDTKDDILNRELADGSLLKPAIFVGDSRYDHEAAVRAGLDFVFISGWTEFREWREYCALHTIASVAGIGQIASTRLYSSRSTHAGE